MNKQQRKSRGQRASGTVTWPGQGRRSPSPFYSWTCAVPRGPLPSGSHRTRGSTPTPFAHPAPGAQDQGPEKKAEATRRQIGDLPSPDALHHQWRCVRQAPGKVGGRGERPAVLGAAGLGPRRGQPRGHRRDCRDFPPVTFSAVSTRLPSRLAGPSEARAQNHVWFCFF